MCLQYLDSHGPRPVSVLVSALVAHPVACSVSPESIQEGSLCLLFLSVTRSWSLYFSLLEDTADPEQFLVAVWLGSMSSLSRLGFDFQTGPPGTDGDPVLGLPSAAGLVPPVAAGGLPRSPFRTEVLIPPAVGRVGH